MDTEKLKQSNMKKQRRDWTQTGSWRDAQSLQKNLSGEISGLREYCFYPHVKHHLF